VVLYWTAASGATSYHVYRDTAPYFAPVAPVATTTLLSYTDAGAIGDPNLNNFYLVGAFNASGETLCAQRMGEFDYALTVGPPGDLALNDIAIPLDVSGDIADAESLATWIEQEGGAPFGAVAQLLKWDAPSQNFLAWSHEYGFGDNFEARPGDSVLLVVNEQAPAFASFVGWVMEPGTVSFLLTPGIAGMCALNFLSLPFDQEGLESADKLSDNIGTPDVTVLQALDWDAPTQNFLAWSNEYGFGDDFPTAIGYPYIVCLGDTDVPPTWP
jgi:hypothetical protein